MSIIELATPDGIVTALSRYRFVGVDEYAIQDGIAQALSRVEIPFEREVRLSARDRLDFLVGSIAIEVKTQGTRPNIWRQLARYAEHEQVEHIVLASTKRALLAGLPENIGGVPVTGVVLRGRL